jgi:hypothetical protein
VSGRSKTNGNKGLTKGGEHDIGRQGGNRASYIG